MNLLTGWSLIGTTGLPFGYNGLDIELGLTTGNIVRISPNIGLPEVSLLAGFVIQTTAGYQIGQWHPLDSLRDLIIPVPIQDDNGSRWYFRPRRALPNATVLFLYEKNV